MEVETILSSVAEGCPRISTLRLRYWRAIHSEFMTHRAFSRNASSSRAIPVERLAESTANNLFIPVFRKNRKGMQPGDYLSHQDQLLAQNIWSQAADACLRASEELSKLGVHKQWANRPLEWFGYINVLVTSTDWGNFLELRTAVEEGTGLPIPQDEMYELARTIESHLKAVVPQVLKPVEWHLPYVKEEEKSLDIECQKTISAARCASISYQTVDGKEMSLERALELGHRLIERKHWSPFEHQAMVDYRIDGEWAHRSMHANYTGWCQNRHFLMKRL